MNAYRTALLIVHVLSAIIGIGSTFTFGVIGAVQSKIQGPGALALLEVNEAIGKRLVTPFALLLLPLSGALMIFARGWSTDFWAHQWLWGAIVLFIIVAGIGQGVLEPGVRKLIDMGREGRAGSPEFTQLVRIQQRLGPVTSVLAVVIIVLMVWKPGG
jgi:hypothetical protein